MHVLVFVCSCGDVGRSVCCFEVCTFPQSFRRSITVIVATSYYRFSLVSSGVRILVTFHFASWCRDGFASLLHLRSFAALWERKTNTGRNIATIDR